MNRIKTLFFFILFIQSATLWSADLKLPTLLASHMVLQQQSEVMLWGWAKKGDSVSIKTSWDPRVKHTIASKDGTWKISITTVKAEGSHEIIISADTTIVLKDILMGEVWVCSGQSNMEMPMKGFASQPVLNSNDFIMRSDNNNIRFFTVERNMSTKPLNDCVGSWQAANPENVADFSAVAYFYGKALNESLGVPIGLISASWGGTPAKSWSDKSVVKEFNEIDLSGLQKEEFNQRSPTVLFNAMIHPLLNFTIKGVIWYQGEADRTTPEQYEKLFPAMIKNWRTQWRQGDFPFYYVQIAPYKYDTTINSAFLREAQMKTLKNVINTGMAVTMDIGEYGNIHPKDKNTVGKRLAYCALSQTYQIPGIKCNGPIFREMEINQNKVTLFFDYAELGFLGLGNELMGFTVAGQDKVFYPEKATVNRKNNSIEIWCAHVKTPVAVRYCWENYSEGTLYNTAGLPASSFRTDEWPEE